MPGAFDEKELLERVGDDMEFLRETVEMLASDGPELMTQLRAAVDAGDAAGVGRVGHTLKGMVSNFAASNSVAAALAVEQIGKSGDLAKASEAIQALDVQVQQLIADLNAFCAAEDGT